MIKQMMKNIGLKSVLTLLKGNVVLSPAQPSTSFIAVNALVFLLSDV